MPDVLAAEVAQGDELRVKQLALARRVEEELKLGNVELAGGLLAQALHLLHVEQRELAQRREAVLARLLVRRHVVLEVQVAEHDERERIARNRHAHGC